MNFNENEYCVIEKSQIKLQKSNEVTVEWEI